MIIYSTHKTSRLQYISNILFEGAAQITNDVLKFKNHQGIKINYSTELFVGNIFNIFPHSILFESIIKKQDDECFEYNGLKAFFKTNGDFPFDLFAASFYLITRYEEYLPHSKDEYGRYDHHNSLAYKEGFLKQPLINLWLKEFEKQITQKYSGFYFSKTNFKFIASYDIDIAYKYLGKGFLRNVLLLVKSLVQGNVNQLKEQARTLSGKIHDPFDVYYWLEELHNSKKISAIYFFLIPDRVKGYDKNIHPGKIRLQKLIKEISTSNEIGIHPSWQSNEDENLLKEEKNVLSSISQFQITKSRQHYIRLIFPQTYQSLIRSQLTDDYSMGYGSINGFRASYAKPFTWYDLSVEQETALTVHPFCYMDANAIFEEKITSIEALEEMNSYYNIIQSVNGECIFILHNHFLSNESEWSEWKNNYKNFLMNI